MAAFSLIFSFGTLFLCLFEVKPLYRMIQDIWFYNRNERTAELTENSLNLLINSLCWRSYLNSRSCAHTRSCDSRSVHPTTFTGGWGCPISIMCRSLTSSFHCRCERSSFGSSQVWQLEVCIRDRPLGTQINFHLTAGEKGSERKKGRRGVCSRFGVLLWTGCWLAFAWGENRCF